MLSHDVVDPAECGRFDVVQPADLIASATWQPLVAWHADAERVVVRRGRRLVIRDEEIAVPRAEVARVERDVAPELVLHLHGSLPVVILEVVPTERIRHSTRAAGADLPERQIRPRTAFAIRRRIPQVARSEERRVGKECRSTEI